VDLGDTNVEVDNTTGLQVGDYIFNGGKYISLSQVGVSSVSISSTITQQILSGVAITFSRLFDTEEVSTISAIPIENTFISGVGVTDKLSGNLYVYKQDDRFIGFTTSPADALLNPPKLIQFTGLGVGINHFITSTNQNSKSLILIDNIAQAPIVATSVTSSLASNLNLSSNILSFTGITSFFSGDLIEIEDEIMKIIAVGVGNSVEVSRPILGSSLKEHSQNTLITKLKGNYKIKKNILYFDEAPYGPIVDGVNGDINVRSSFQGRVFLRSADVSSGESAYNRNYVFDDISDQFDASTKSFTVKSDKQDIVGFSELNSIVLINNIIQIPTDNFNLTENLSQTQLNFTGTGTSIKYDVNNASIPRRGIIVATASSNGFGYQPLVSAGGTAVVSIAGTIQSISIGNSGSGYRSGIQTSVNVKVQSYSNGKLNTEFVGVASISDGNVVGVNITNPGSGYTSTNPPEVIFDSPFSYSDLRLKVNSGIGTEASIDIVVGQGSSVIDFTIKNFGYSYNIGDVLTLDVGGTTGIPTNTALPYREFKLVVERVFSDDFSGWSLGELETLDELDELFDGNKTTFPISRGGNRFAIIKEKGGNIELNTVLLVFINDVLQEPDVAYKFNGGSTITFTEAPKNGDKGRIIFYKGTPNIDVIDVDLLETIKTGDKVELVGDKFNLIEQKRLVTDILLPDVLETNPYSGKGITEDSNLFRPLNWYRQRNDLIIDKKEVNKSRVRYESYVNPTAKLIQSVGIGSTQIFVDSVKTIFDPQQENISPTSPEILKTIQIIDNSELVSAAATAIVSAAGTIQSIVISNGGVGYTTSLLKPEISASIQYPIGIGKSGVATLKTNLVGGSISSIDVISPGFGYTQTNPPLVLIEERSAKVNEIKNVSYLGDFGIITGIATTSVGLASTGLVFDFFIPNDSYLRNINVNNPTTNTSNISENYYFKLSNSKVGSGLTSLRSDGSIIGIGTENIDNIYQAISVSAATTEVYGGGTEDVIKVTVSVSDYNQIDSSIGYGTYFGDFSWGLIEIPTIDNEYSVSPEYGVVGLNTTPTIRRVNRLRFANYDNI